MKIWVLLVCSLLFTFLSFPTLIRNNLVLLQRIWPPGRWLEPAKGLVSELRPDEVIEELEEAEEPKESKEPKEAAEEVVDVLPTSPVGSCDMTAVSAASFQWGWDGACFLTRGGDEPCEMFRAAPISSDPKGFVQTARRARDAKYHPNLAKLKARVVQALLEGRPLKIVGMGPSTTFGRGCPGEEHRWTNSLQNLSSFTGSRLRLEVINQARPATPISTQWRSVLEPYREDPMIDLIVVDYTVTSTDAGDAKRSAALVYSFLQTFEHPPALLFLETFAPSEVGMMVKGVSACNIARDFDNSDPFYPVLKTLRLPLLSYPDIACRMHPLNRTTRSLNGVAVVHAYPDQPHNVAAHFGCGVHLILAHMIHLYLNQIIQESCDAAEQEACTGALNDVCAKGFARTIEEFKLQKDEVLNLSKEENCEMHIATSLAHSGPFGFAAFVSASASKWRLGADRPGKYGWIANDVPAELVNLEKPQRGWPLLSTYPRYSKLKASEIVFLVRSTLGIVFVDYLSSYNNIGSATCQLEDLQGQALGPSVTIDALWSKQMSISQRVTLEMGTTPPGGLRGPNVAVRCTEEGKKFKFIGISSC